MKKRKYTFWGILLVVCFIFTGCGEQMYELTDEEVAMIADYSAKVVAKHNKAQSVGLCSVAEDASDEEESTKDDTSTDTENDTDTQAGNKESTDTDVSSVSITDALAVDGISFAYTGFEVKGDYQSSDYFVLTPNNGYAYLIYNFEGVNNTDQDIAVDLLSKNLIFRATINDSETASAETTILLNDLATYSDTIAAGESQSFVLLFQVKTDILSNITTNGLQLKSGGETTEILLQ